MHHLDTQLIKVVIASQNNYPIDETEIAADDRLLMG
jgi:hypothetical protein